MLALNYFKSINKQIIYYLWIYSNPKLLLPSYKQFNSTQNHFLKKQQQQQHKTFIMRLGASFVVGI